MISERYAKFLEKTQNRSPRNDDCRLLLRVSAGEDHNGNVPNNSNHNQVTGVQEEPWDDFDDNNIKKALEEVLHYKRISKLDASKQIGPTCEDWSDRNTNSEEYVIIESLHLRFINTNCLAKMCVGWVRIRFCIVRTFIPSLPLLPLPINACVCGWVRIRFCIVCTFIIFCVLYY